jgi:sec-independent protein translocase protein TatA
LGSLILIAGGLKVNIFGIGLPEMAVIMIVALLIFGPKKLPEIGRSMGKTIRSFQEASREFETEFKREAEHLEETVKTTAELEPKQIAAEAEENFSPQLSNTAERVGENSSSPQLSKTADAENHAATTLEQN